MLSCSLNSLYVARRQPVAGVPDIARQFTANSGVETYDLMVHGAPPYHLTATSGYTLSGSVLSVDTSADLAPTMITEGRGVPFTFDASDLVPATLQVTGDHAHIPYGRDTSPSKTFLTTIDREGLEAAVVSWNTTDLAALTVGEGIPKQKPIAAVTSPSGTPHSVGQVGDIVELVGPAIYLFKDQPGTVTHQLLDKDGSSLTFPYVISDTSLGPLKFRADDGFGNTIESDDIMLSPPSGLGAPVTFVSAQASTATPDEVIFDLSDHNGSDDIIFMFSLYAGSGAPPTLVTLNGQAAEVFEGQPQSTFNRPTTGWAKFTAADIQPTSTFAVTVHNANRLNAAAYYCPSGATVQTIASQIGQSPAQTTMDLSGDITPGSSVLAAVFQFGGKVPVLGTWGDLSQDADLQDGQFASISEVSGGSVTIAPAISNATLDNAGISVEVKGS